MLPSRLAASSPEDQPELDEGQQFINTLDHCHFDGEYPSPSTSSSNQNPHTNSSQSLRYLSHEFYGQGYGQGKIAYSRSRVPGRRRALGTYRFLAGSHWVEQEALLDDDDGDSTLGSDVESSTASITSSILRYRTIKGRTYHSDATTNQEYWGPNDEKANEMLDIFHHFMTLLFDGKLYTAPIKDDIEIALDLCTGTGLWAIDFADEMPKCNVYGTDISPIQPSWVPPNVQFDIDDAIKPWTYRENFFDYVHIRWLTGVFKDWNAIHKEAYRVMKPGAWIEHVDADVHAVCEDGTMPNESAIAQWGEIWSEVGRKTGFIFNMVDSGCMENGIKEAGFTNIQVKDILAPCSGWPTDPKQKELGLFSCCFLTQDVEGFLTYFLGQIMGWTDKEMANYAACLRKDFRGMKIHASMKWRVVVAQKPLDA